MENEQEERELLGESWEEFVDRIRPASLEDLTEGFTSYPLYWNDAICFTRNPLECIPGCLLGEDS